MSAPVRSYRPEINILIDGQDYTHLLADVGSVTLRKNLYAPTGEARIVLADMPIGKTTRDNAYGLLSLIIPVEIKIRRWREGEAALKWVTVFRGILRSAGRDEQVGADGRVQRRVLLQAHDCGVVFLMQQIHPFIAFGITGVPNTPMGFWLKELGMLSKLYPAAEFIWKAATLSTNEIMSGVGYSFDQKFSVEEGNIQPSHAFSQEGPLWGMLDRYADRPWNELFVREGEATPELVYRPTPWRDSTDGWIKPVGETPKTRTVQMRDILSLSAHRDDAEFINHAKVVSPAAHAAGLVQFESKDTGLLNGETAGRFGHRIKVQPTFHLPPTLPINLPQAEQLQSNANFRDWIAKRRDWIKAAGEDIWKLERGSVVIKGYPEHQVGEYIEIDRGELKWLGYVTDVVQEFVPFQRYTSTLNYIRGNQWLRRKEVTNPWEKERQVSNAS